MIEIIQDIQAMTTGIRSNKDVVNPLKTSKWTNWRFNLTERLSVGLFYFDKTRYKHFLRKYKRMKKNNDKT